MSQKINNNRVFPTLNTERLSMIRLQLGHKDDLFMMRSDLEHHLYTDTLPDQSIEETVAYIEKMNKGVEEGKWLIWGIENRSTNKIIGTVSLWNFDFDKGTGELGYGLIKTAQHQGFMRETLSAVIHYGFEELGLKEIHAYTEMNNLNSVQLLEKMDFIHSDTIEENGYLVSKTFIMGIYVLKNNR